MSTEFVLFLVIFVGILYFFKTRYNRNNESPPKTSADFKMGTDYAFGLGFPELDKLAAEAFTAMARNGDVDSYAALGNMYSRGVHFDKDYEESAKWYRLAADAGHATAMSELAVLYIDGLGVPKNSEEAVSLINKAANLGEPTAQSRLGMFYEAGAYGLDEDLTESLSWYMKAAQQGNSFSELKVGDAYVVGALIHLDVKKGIEYITKAAEKGYIAAIERLGTYYDQGLEGLAPNPVLSFEWYMKGAELGDASCEYGVGFDYLTGKGVEKDYEEAARWILKSAEKGYVEAEYTIGIMVLRGIYFESDIENSKDWFRKAAAQGHESALEELKKLEN